MVLGGDGVVAEIIGGSTTVELSGGEGTVSRGAIVERGPSEELGVESGVYGGGGELGTSAGVDGAGGRAYVVSLYEDDVKVVGQTVVEMAIVDVTITVECAGHSVIEGAQLMIVTSWVVKTVEVKTAGMILTTTMLDVRAGTAVIFGALALLLSASAASVSKWAQYTWL